jgi:alpha-1,2-glucosyltransferase
MAHLYFFFQKIGEVVLTALALATFPVLYFFTFLYYTDPVSTFFALLTYFYSLRSQHKSAAVAGVFAVLCRQTNIMWVVFSAGITVGKILICWIQLEKKQNGGREKISDFAVLKQTVTLLVRALRHKPKEVFLLVTEILQAVWSYIIVGIGFAVFIVINEGIVVGDRSNHQPCLNFPQVFYFLFLTTFFSFMLMVSLSSIKHFFNHTIKYPFQMITFFLVAVVFVMKFMFIHEYNLADNRHYNFYFLSKLIRRNEHAKFVFIPVYWFSFVTFWKLLEQKDVFWKLSFLICTMATVVPQRMVEFRYFILPYLVFRLNMPIPSKAYLFVEVLFYFAINAWTVYMYVYKPFPWANSKSLQRFMW